MNSSFSRLDHSTLASASHSNVYVNAIKMETSVAAIMGAARPITTPDSVMPGGKRTPREYVQ